MLPAALSLVLLLYSSVCAAYLHEALDFSKPSAKDGRLEARLQPIDDVVVVPGSSYIAKIECKDCPYAEYTKESERKIVKTDQIFLMNFTLSHNNRTILLDGNPVYPLQTIPSPPSFRVLQFSPSISNKNLSSGLACSDLWCSAEKSKRSPPCVDWCSGPSLPSILLDYLYTTKPTGYTGEGNDADAQYWEIALDIIGGWSGHDHDPYSKFDNASQKMVRILVAGREAKLESYTGKTDTKAAGDLFAPGGDEKTYEFEIVDMRLEARAYTFPAEKTPTLWDKVGRFFGNDVWEEDGRRFIYRGKEWGDYGKQGSLRKMLGDIVHWDEWNSVFVIAGSTIAGLIVLFGIYKLWLWLQEQNELAKWDGMDDVWDNLRRERTAEEDDALLQGGYRDDPDEGESSRTPTFTDEPRTMKPLPTKPLPEKPLPDVPLIDA
ncbi:uncharacterized protein K460DRAFT_372136 [Cucurbitaria berberidis CBS 394.84]|uniref:Uncharacterized protein n=1 Tax=Cucurbitaria berberidis CBS 394.84 TaxID=1168544 RepID=A0A9P4GR96_9PLEO|nr:uncharacterized protein K460DRAFT_372136 [Cucurbitaria berberidis CBS 394.84]KAF1849656.1 hypothetical protein K460DRAFT_372136 [Cucurbitaria berberidis CBS 394.84]